MALANLFKKATSFLGLSPLSANKVDHLDGEIIYCKNNVCVHPPASFSVGSEHNPGYLTLRAQNDEVLGSTLILHWIPNSSLTRNPRSVENSPSFNEKSCHRQAREEYARKDEAFLTAEESGLADYGISNTSSCKPKSSNDCSNKAFENCSVINSRDSSEIIRDENFETDKMCNRRAGHSVSSIEMIGDQLVIMSEEQDDSAIVSASSSQITVSTPDSFSSTTSNTDSGLCSVSHGMIENNDVSHSSNAAIFCEKNLDRQVDNLSNANLPALEINVTGVSLSEPAILIIEDSDSSSATTSGPDSNLPSPISASPVHEHASEGQFDSHNTHSPQSSTGSGTMTYNLRFPENSVSFGRHDEHISVRDQLCGVFSVDLGQMRSVRVFFCNEDCTSGQIVIASRESQYKVLHFHSGGLDRLVDVLSTWKFFTQPKQKSLDRATHCHHFSVVRPNLSDKLTHPEEKTYEPVNEVTWRRHMNELGQIEDELQLCKAIFFAGVTSGLRHEIWPFLLHYFPYHSTFEEREQIRNDKYLEYQRIRKTRDSMSQLEKEEFWRNVEYIVEKDVVRTDRSHDYFRGDHNPNLSVLRDILLNYAVAHPLHGYTQGMSDLLAPLLIEIQNEVDTYWCFVGLMQRAIFVSSPKDIDMDRQLLYMRELLRLMVPKFYHHLKTADENMDLLFTHRWILLCFKREFVEAEALRMWEACWVRYQTDYFHLFISLAIIALYGEEVVQQALPADEMLLHFSSLSMHMNATFVLSKARCLLHQFRIMATIPCTLVGLCSHCAPGMWDSGHVPAVQCTGGHGDDACPGSTDHTS